LANSGTNGQGFLRASVSLPADNNKEYRGYFTSVPASGNFHPYEDGSLTFTGAADGTYTAVYQLWEDGVNLGSATISMTVGTSSVVVTTAWTEGSETSAAAVKLKAALASAWAEGSETFALATNVGTLKTANLNWTEGSESHALVTRLNARASSSWTEGSEVQAAVTRLNARAAAAWTEGSESPAAVLKVKLPVSAYWEEGSETHGAIVRASARSSAAWTEGSEAQLVTAQAVNGTAISVSAGWVEGSESQTSALKLRIRLVSSWIEGSEGHSLSIGSPTLRLVSLGWTEGSETVVIAGSSAAVLPRPTITAGGSLPLRNKPRIYIKSRR
jgi:hypothetical protein